MKKTMLLAAVLMLTTACQESLEKRLEREYREITEKGPQPVSLQDGRGVTYVMTRDSLVFDVATKTDRQYFTWPDELPTPSKEQIIEQLKNEPAYRQLRENGFNFYFIYRSHHHPGTTLFETTITKNDYQ